MLALLAQRAVRAGATSAGRAALRLRRVHDGARKAPPLVKCDDKEADERAAIWADMLAPLAPIWRTVHESAVGRALAERVAALFHAGFEYRPDGRGRPMGFQLNKVDLTTRIPFAKWNMAKALNFLAIEQPLPRLSLAHAPPVSEETLYRFVTALQEVTAVFPAASRDPQIRHLLLGRYLQEIITPFPNLTVHVGRKTVGRYAYGPLHYSVGMSSSHVPCLIVLECGETLDARETARAMALIQLRSAFERNVAKRRRVDRLYAVVSDTRHWHIIMYEPLVHRYSEADAIVVADLYDIDNLELLLCALTHLMQEANGFVATARLRVEDSAKWQHAHAADRFVPFHGLVDSASDSATIAEHGRRLHDELSERDDDADDYGDEDDAAEHDGEREREREPREREREREREPRDAAGNR